MCHVDHLHHAHSLCMISWLGRLCLSGRSSCGPGKSSGCGHLKHLNLKYVIKGDHPDLAWNQPFLLAGFGWKVVRNHIFTVLSFNIQLRVCSFLSPPAADTTWKCLLPDQNIKHGVWT